MKRSSKPIKSYSKTIRAYSNKIDEDTFQKLNQLFVNYGKCRNMFLNQYCGINHMLDVKNYRQLRDYIKKSGKNKLYLKKYNFLDKHWRYALNDACANINAMWSNLANQIRKVVQANELVDEDEQHLIYYLLSIRELWYYALTNDQTELFNLPKRLQKHLAELEQDLTAKQRKHAYSYLRRLTRRYKYVPRKHTSLNKSMTYDESMYKFIGNQLEEISISSHVSRKRFNLKLTSSWHYRLNGNLQLILDRNKKRLEIHKVIQVRQKKKYQGKQKLGIDKGLATLVSCSSGREYGKGFSQLIRPQIEKESQYLAQRNPYYGRRYQLRKQLDKLANVKNIKDIIKRKQLSIELKQIENNNLGHKRKDKRHEALNACRESFINHSIKEMIEHESPSLIVKEDLTFTKDKTSKKGNKYERRVRRNLSSWTKGVLNERLEYYCQQYGIDFKDINPAYTSQYCPNCGQRFEFRFGKHNEKTICPNCGEMNCNVAASKNILVRANDKEITLYTPYKKVKAILEQRIAS